MGRVLVVDDDPLVCAGLTQLLEADGHDVMLASHGREVQSKALLGRPDLIFLDISLPLMDGFEAMAMLKMDPGTADIPVITMTAKSYNLPMMQALGAVDHIVKPWAKGEIVTRADIAIRSAGRQSADAPAPVSF